MHKGCNVILKSFLNLLPKIEHEIPKFPPTILYNEGWLLRLIIDWFSTSGITATNLNSVLDRPDDPATADFEVNEVLLAIEVRTHDSTLTDGHASEDVLSVELPLLLTIDRELADRKFAMHDNVPFVWHDVQAKAGSIVRLDLPE